MSTVPSLKNRKSIGFWRKRDGTAAIEFAIIAPVFLALMFSIFEVGWFHFVNSTVNIATTQSARIVRTGQVQLGGTSEQEYFQSVCNVVDIFGECDTTLTVDVTTFADFAALAMDTSDATCRDAPQAEIDNIPYNPGNENEIVRVRICVLYKTINPAIGVNLSETGSSIRRVSSTLIFRNEPYERNL